MWGYTLLDVQHFVEELVGEWASLELLVVWHCIVFVFVANSFDWRHDDGCSRTEDLDNLGYN